MRYAVYLAPPPDTPLWTFGSAVLGYDAATGRDVPPPDLAGFDAPTWAGLTAEPRRYGFHGTLKAPFRLAEDCRPEDLAAALAALADQHHAFDLGPLEVRELGAFIALVPGGPAPALEDLAGCAVVDLDPLRAPLTAAEMARRRPEDLSERQRDHLLAYGYPYVLADFRFHMTLTGPLDAIDRPRALNSLAAAYAASGADQPLRVADIVLFAQEMPQDRFHVLDRFPLRGA